MGSNHKNIVAGGKHSMELEKVYQAIMDGKALLITGSGAHEGALTPDGAKFPSGIDLAKAIYLSCGITKPENPYDLQDAADTFLEEKTADMFIVELKKMLLVGKVQPEHKNLYSQPWQRVYTTNYDEIPLLATKEEISTLIPATLKKKVRERDDDIKYCVYINGYIGRLNEETLQSEFRLSGKSYVASDVLDNSEFGAVFSEDIETADCIVIVGLSLDYDLDLKRFIYNQNVIDKTVFIERKGITTDKERKLKRMGKVYPMDMKCFVEELMDYRTTHLPNQLVPNAYIYRSFIKNQEKRTWKKATAREVYSLLMLGQYSDALWHREKGKYESLVYRKALKDVVSALNSGCRVIYVHANLGNGKTIFIESLKHQIQKRGYQIFTLKEFYQSITAKEIKYIVELPGKKIIIVENYYNYLNVLEKFSRYPLDDIQFILSARTVLYDTRIMEANEYLRVKEGQSTFIDLNKLVGAEIEGISKILSLNGLWGNLSNLSETEKRKYLCGKKAGNAEFQGILVDVVQSTDMKQKIEDIVSRIKNVSDSYYETLILALLIKIMSLNINADEMSRIMGINVAFDACFVHDVNVQEILDFSSGKTEFKIKSAVTANMILKELDCNETIIKVLVLTAKYANKYHGINRYENILKNVISYSHVKTFLLKSGQKEAFLFNYYDSLKGLEYYKENTFFWLQYAIACSNIGSFDLAQTYLDSAYSFFYDSEYTVPFQIDTQQARLYLLRIESDSTCDTAELFEKAHLLLMKPVVSSKDNEAKQIRLLKYYVQKSITSKLPQGFRQTYHKYCGEAYNKVNQYSKKVDDKLKDNEFKQLREKLLRASVG